MILMEQTYYVYKKHEFNLTIHRMPIWFREETLDGDEKAGHIILHSANEFDENWKANAKMEITWEPKSRLDFAHYKEVQKSIDIYNSISVVVSKKENTWVNSHEFTFWFGNRRKRIGRNYYVEQSIHGVFYCDQTERLFSLHTTIIDKHYENFKPYIKECYQSIHCH
jgi:hypothetical protein